MRDFLIALLQCSVSMSLVTLVYAAMLPLFSKRYAAKWRYMVWLVIAVGWIFPFRPRIDLSFLPAQMADIPITPVQLLPSASDTLPSPITTARDIVNAPETIPLWWGLAAIWILGVVSVILYHSLRHGRFMKMIHRWSEPVTDLESLGILDSLKLEMGIKAQVGLSVCQSITSPMLVGFFRPAILLPPVKIADDELSLILKHELIHLKRHDLWYKALILTATVLHWFNPVVYLMAKAAAVQCEISCDALVLQDADFQQRKQYGEAIIGIVKNGAKLRTALSTDFYGGKKGMKNRISSIMDTSKKKAGFVILCVVLVAIIGTGVALAVTNNENGDNSTIESIAREFIDNEILNYEQLGVEIIDSKISFLELASKPGFDNLADRTVYVFLLEYRLLPKDLRKAELSLSGGMRIDEEGWITEWSSMGQPLIVAFEEKGKAELIGVLWTAEISEKNGGLEAAVRALLEPSSYPTELLIDPNNTDIMQVKNGTATPSGATITLKNVTDTECTFGESYTVQRKTDNGWIDVVPVIESYGFNDIGYMIPAMGSKEINIDWEWIYGKLPIGDYRIVKEVLFTKSQGDYDTFTLYAAFTIAK